MINRHNCDTISNEPFIEPHFYNLEKLGTTDSGLGAAASPDPPSWPNGASNTLTGAIKYPPPASFYNLIADKPGPESHVPAFSHPTPGMLSAALQGNLPPVSHQPPTPPRTPQGNKFDAEARPGQGAGLMPKMPSLFALQGLQHQMLSGGGAKPGPSLHQPLTSQLNKQGLQGKQILHLPTLICPNLQKKDF